MSLYKVSQFANTGNKMHQRQRGVIYDNADPEKRGRVRVTIPGIFETKDKNKHPWIYPQSGYELNGSGKEANLHVPRIGSTVNIEFHGGSPYHGVYVGTYRHENNTNYKPFETNYPYRYGSVDASGNQTIHDMKDHTFTYNHVAQDDTQSDDNDQENTKQDQATSQDPKASHSYSKDGSIATNTKGSHTTGTQGDSNHTIGGKYTKVSSGDMLHKTDNSMTHKASETITHSAGSDIVNQADKIFLN